MSEEQLRVIALEQAVNLIVGLGLPETCSVSLAEAMYRFLKEG